MKNFKKITLGILGATLLALGLYSCNNDESKDLNSQNTESLNTFHQRGQSDIKIAEIRDGHLVPLINISTLKAELIQKEIFLEIESIEIDSEFDKTTNLYESYITIIGKDVINYDLMAFQVDLIREGEGLYFPNPNNPELPKTIFAKHGCAGFNCRSCQFERSGFLNLKIIGCKPCGAVIDDKKTGGCNHSINGGGPAPAEIAKEIITIIA